MSARVAQSKIGKLFSFAVAGGSGFIVDIVVLRILMDFTPLGPFTARILSIACAMFSNFMVNRTFTFGASDKPFFEEMARYASVGAVGAVLNYIIYAMLLLAVPGFSPFLATFIAVVLVSVFSWFGYSRFVFTKR